MGKKKYSTEQYAATARKAVAEGIVMLRNEGGLLPLPAGSRIALFGRSQFCYYKSGTGSGGLVNTAYVTGIREALEQDGRFVLNQELRKVYEEWLESHPFDTGKGWAQEPWFQEEMPVSAQLAESARRESDTAVIIIGRTAGEDKDNKAEEGSYLLTKTEEELLKTVCAVFERTVVLLNTGNIIDMKWVERYCPGAVLYVWQGGQEGGSGVLDVLTGDVCPSGRLADTIAYDIADYPSTKYYGDTKRNFYAEDIYVGYRYFSTFAPEKVLYPFGFGLSYTEFEVSAEVLGSLSCKEAGKAEENSGTTVPEGVTVRARVKNVGACAGKEVVQVYCQAPQGALGKAARVLCGFGKTKELAPGETEELEIKVPVSRVASYDDSGVTGHKSCYVLEAGEYLFYAGVNVRDAVEAGAVTCEELVVTEQLEEAYAPVTAFECMRPGARRADGVYETAWQQAALRTEDPMLRRRERLPEEYACTGDKGYRLWDVESGKVSMGEFLAQLTDEELCCMIRGEGMCSPKVTPGTAGAFGGVTEALQNYGIPAGCCADGPSGIRMDCGTIAFAMPNGTSLACTFNEELVGELYEWEGLELRKNQVDTLLGPGMNIHRNPLNGRNFEYFSEDPYLTGKMAAAQVRGLKEAGVTGTLKHFAANSQETKRTESDSVISERALREIYLKGFEIAVKEGGADSVMTTYGSLNGVWTAGRYELNTSILRGEWGFEGIVMTDWWAKVSSQDRDEPARGNDLASMIRAQNDLYMVCPEGDKNLTGDNTLSELEKGDLTKGELQRSAINICRQLLQTPAYLRKTGEECLVEVINRPEEMEDFCVDNIEYCEVNDVAEISMEQADTSRDSSFVFAISVKSQGLYEMEIEFCSDLEPMAQIPMTVFAQSVPIGSITFNGTSGQWETVTKRICIGAKYGVLRLHFAQSGARLKTMRFRLVEKAEDENNPMEVSGEYEMGFR